MLRIETLARTLVTDLKFLGLHNSVFAALEEELHSQERMRDTYNAQAMAANDQHLDNDDIEVDDEPLIAPGEGGVWVSSWVWVPVEQEDPDEEQNLQCIASGR